MVGRDEDPTAALGQFLLDQGRAAGLSARDIERHFQRRADQEKARVAAGQEAPVDPVNDMSYSKSHLDRLFKGAASLPSKRFIKIFLEITSSAAGVRQSFHIELVRKADDLLAAAHQWRRSQRVTKPSELSAKASSEPAVATLQVQLELERAHRIEDSLRWALSDTQLLITTLLQIISTLREIVIELDAWHIQALRAGADLGTTNITENQRVEALAQKATAESQLARANARRMLLESLWEQAHSNVHRLSLHTGLKEVVTLPVGPALPAQKPVAADLLPHSGLQDIAAALGKAEEINTAEDRQVYEWQQNLTSNAALQPDDEYSILLAATRLTDAANRTTAINALIKDWSQNPETRDALVRLTLDEDMEVRLTATRSLAKNWSGDGAAREAVTSRTRDHDSLVQKAAVWGLAQAWQGDSVARDALVTLTRDNSEETREIAVEGLAQGWSGDVAARDALLPLASDNVRCVRETTVEMLLEGWPGDLLTRDALLDLVQSDDTTLREMAASGLCIGWPDDATVSATFVELLHDASPIVRWAAERQLNKKGNAFTVNPRPSLKETESRDDSDEWKHSLGGTVNPKRKPSSKHDCPLVASRVPYDYSTDSPLEVISTLRRGMGFTTGINHVSGNNGSGKTILLMALALRAGAVTVSDLKRFGYMPPLVLELAEKIDLLWHKQPSPNECFYLNQDRGSQSRRYVGVDRALNDARYRLFLLDEPWGAFVQGRMTPAAHLMNQRAQEGCQFIVVSQHFRPVGAGSVNSIRIGRRRMLDGEDLLR
ncbi:HEAT repeat domain-containing protein [Streptomyces sp. NPDC013161]|uniref:HEAT repeat domain-containing protein n=1 Tax=Streptomyces sp. NPDC013161 TaxID=3364862 RepID=UPI0036D02327